MKKHKRIVFAGSRAQRPGRGGQIWVFLQYLLGLRRLGWDVLCLDALESESCADPDGRPLSAEALEDSWNVRYFRAVLRDFGLEDSFSLVCDGGTRFIGLPRAEVLERVRGAACLINVMGFLRDEEILAAARRRVFLDIDPGFGQLWRQLGLADVFAGHDDYVTVGQNVGRPGCDVPDCGIDWIASLPPVVLERWPQCPPNPSGPFTSVASWRGAFGPVEYQGRTYGLRVHEFRKFFPLPGRTGEPFEIALDIHPDETPDLQQLRANGWRLVDPASVAGTPQDYQEFIRRSKAEFQVAKNMYVDTHSGWFSERTACYLASGRPALLQDTGLRDRFPGQEGLVFFSDLDEAAEGARRICRDYEKHATAARRIAEEHFDSDKVLTRLLNKLGIS